MTGETAIRASEEDLVPAEDAGKDEPVTEISRLDRRRMAASSVGRGQFARCWG